MRDGDTGLATAPLGSVEGHILHALALDGAQEIQDSSG